MALLKMVSRFQKSDFAQTPQQKPSSYKTVFLVSAVLFIALRIISHIVLRAGIPAIPNTGIAFGISVGGIAPYGIAIAACVFFAVLVIRFGEALLLPFAVIMAAGASNLFDRIAYGAVFDFITIGTWNGNAADIVVLGGIVWMIWGIIYSNARAY